MTEQSDKNKIQIFFSGKRKWIVVLIAAVVAAICLIAFWLIPMVGAPAPVKIPEATPVPAKTPMPGSVPTPIQLQILSELEQLYAQNNDLAGWIKIAGTVVDYPVMYTPQDGEFYLYRTFEKQDDPSKQGCIFIDKHCSIDPRDDNLLIHGHNMKNGSMFHTLIEYEKEEFYKQHPIIEFSTLYRVDEYEIAAVFLSKIYNKTDDAFKFYQFYDAKTKEEFDGFVKNIKDRALYETGITPQYGDRLITLSTCEYSQENGRIVVVARAKAA